MQLPQLFQITSKLDVVCHLLVSSHEGDEGRLEGVSKGDCWQQLHLLCLVIQDLDFA